MMNQPIEQQTAEFGGYPLGWESVANHPNRLGFQTSSAQATAPTQTLKSYRGEGHLMTIAPTGSGKGRSVMMPVALTYPGSLIVVDPKGEITQVAARRRRELGQPVYVLDPFGITRADSDRLDPLDLLTLPGGQIDCDAEMLASQLSIGHSFGSDLYWSDTAQSLISGLIAYEATTQQPPNRSLVNVRGWFYRSDMDYDLSVVVDKLGDELCTKAREAFVNYLQIPSDKTRPCVRSSAETYCSVLGSQAVSRVIRNSTVPLKELYDGQPMTIFLVIPPDKLTSHAPLVRIWLSTLLTTVGRRTTIPSMRTLFMIDEAGLLGHMDSVQTAVTLLRASGLAVWTFWQDLSQLEQAYPASWKTMMNNCDVLQVFGAGRPFATRLWAELLNCPAREIETQAPDTMLLSQAGQGLIKLRKMDYLLDPLFAGMADPNPRYSKYERGLYPPAPSIHHNR